MDGSDSTARKMAADAKDIAMAAQSNISAHEAACAVRQSSMNTTLAEIKSDIKTLVTQKEFGVVKWGFLGMCGIALSAVVGAIVSLVLTGPPL